MAKSLMECRGEETAQLKRDHFEKKNFTVLTDGYNVWLNEQAVGEMPTQKIEIPKPIFDFLIRKYITSQVKEN